MVNGADLMTSDSFVRQGKRVSEGREGDFGGQGLHGAGRRAIPGRR
jgi:hypothetical protein